MTLKNRFSPSFLRRLLQCSLAALPIMAMLFGSCNAEVNMKKGDQYYAIGEYYEAAEQYKAAYSKTPVKEREKRGERAMKMGECYQRINYTAKAVGAYQNAIRYTEKAMADKEKVAKIAREEQRKKAAKKKAAKHKNDSTTTIDEVLLETSVTDSAAEAMLVKTRFNLARLQHKNGDYKNALKNYESFLQVFPGDTLGMNGMIGCRQALIWKKKPTLHTVKKDPLMNSRRSDFSPVLFGDDFDQLYLTSTRPQSTGTDISGITGMKAADIFVAKKDEKGKWQAPEPVEGDLNSEFEEGVCAFSPDGKTMYLTRCETDPEYPRYAAIYSSSRSDASWAKPQAVNISKDTLSLFAHPTISPDGKYLYFVSDMFGGHGGKDIWRAEIDGNYIGAAENLPAPINTPGDEMFPTFRSNGDLYFSSDGHPGMGGLDLFCAQQDSTTQQWTITNLGYPMNSAGDDFGMTFEGLHNRGFFSSSRGDARGWDHIYTFVCPEVLQTVKGWVYEKDGYELPEGLVYMIGNDGTNKKISLKGDGSFTVEIKPNVEYVFMGTCKGYLNHTEELRADTTEESKEYVLQFPLASTTSPVLLRNVFYEFDSAELTDASTTALDSLASLLEENSTITIELSSHCDYRGADTYNQNLSQRRAESVVNYLIGKGIAADRLTPLGYGESRPKVVKKRVAEQHPFLHEGDILSEDFIKALPEEQQDVCNALNRRTEFRVLRTTYGF